MYKNRLFVEPIGSPTNESLAKWLDDESLMVKQWPVAGRKPGDVADVAELTERQLINLLKSRVDKGFEFNVFEKRMDDRKLYPIKVSVFSDQLNVQQILDRRLQHKLVKIRSRKRPKISVIPEES